MGTKARLYMAYGSNLNLTQMALRCPTAKVVGKSELKGYELLFRGGHRGAVATVEPKEGSTVPVLIWKIQKKDEAALDLYEGYPNFYGKEMLEVELDGRNVSAMAYIMTPGHSFGVPSDYYIDTIEQGYETAGFDTQVLTDAIERAYELAYGQGKREVFGQESLFGIGGYEGMK